MPADTFLSTSDAHLVSEQMITGFLEHKRGLGYIYPDDVRSRVRGVAAALASLDMLTPDSTKTVVEAFTAPREGEATRTWHDRATLTRQFMIFLANQGTDCFIPPPGRRGHHPITFVPRIITSDEMTRIIMCADSWPPHPGCGWSHLVYRMLIRLLWACGLRLGEALALHNRDVDTANGWVTVQHGKNDRTRIVPMSSSLTGYVTWYFGQPIVGAHDPDGFFLPSPKGGGYRVSTASHHVKTIMAKAGVFRDDGTPPRTHDIRHSFAVAALASMQAAGTDLRVGLPLLATFMGHSDISSTEYYLRLTRPEFPTITDAMASTDAIVFPQPDGQ